jgi:hypothetical protein
MQKNLNNLKQKKMRQKFIIIMLLIESIKSFGQDVPLDIVYRINSVDYIFEGKVIGRTPYRTSSGQTIYTSNLIEISKVLKGNLQCGTVELITNGGRIGTDQTLVFHHLELEEGDVGVFLCKETNFELPSPQIFSPTNNLALEGTYGTQSFIKYTDIDGNWTAHDIQFNFDSLNQLYNSAQLITGLYFTDCNNNSILKKKINYEVDTSSYNPIMFSTNNSVEYNANKNWIDIQKLNYTRKKTRNNNTIAFSMSNPIATGLSPKYCEFDIYVSDNLWTKYLDIAYLRIKYPKTVFGDSIVANNKVTVTRGSLINNASCYSNPVPIDWDDSSIFIPITEVVYSQCKQQITSVSQQLIHVKIEIQSCIFDKDIKIEDEIAFGGLSTLMTGSAYAEFPNDTFSTEYDTFSVGNIIKTPKCKATIVDFYPKNISGGTGDTLTITGYQFGIIQGSGNLYFTDADRPSNGLVLPLEANDYILWSDTLIKIKVPSYDTGSIPNPVGSGKFRIINAFGEKDTSKDRLRVFYSLAQYRQPVGGGKDIVLHSAEPTSPTYKFYIDTSISHNIDRLKCVDKAIREWKCATGINFELGNADSLLPHIDQADGINFITFGSNLPLATTFPHLTGCDSNLKPAIYFDFDIVISNNPMYNWYYDTTLTQSTLPNQVDFYYVILHELGHAVGHMHVSDTNKIMFYRTPGSSTYTISPFYRNADLSIDTPAYRGGQRQVGYSSNSANFANCPSYLPIVPTPLCHGFTTNLNTIEVLNQDLLIYPNPTSSLINIESNYLINSIDLYSLDGKLIVHNDFSKTKKIKIDLSSKPILKNQLIFIRISTNNGLISKIIRYE